MERSLGYEIATSFGERLKRFYAQDEQTLPSRMAVCLERLKHAETGIAEIAGDREANIQGLSPSATR